LEPQRLALAGWLSIINAVLTIPTVLLSMFLGAFDGLFARTLSALLTMATTGLFIYVFSVLKELFDDRLIFHDTDVLITVLIRVSIFVAGLSVLGTVVPRLESIVGWFSVLALVAFGVLFIVFGVKLLNMRDTLFGMAKPLAVLTIATGLCFGTIVLIPFGLLASIVRDVVLGVIFFRAAAPASAPGGYTVSRDS
jgi:hypothetical protein